MVDLSDSDSDDDGLILTPVLTKKQQKVEKGKEAFVEEAKEEAKKRREQMLRRAKMEEGMIVMTEEERKRRIAKIEQNNATPHQERMRDLGMVGTVDPTDVLMSKELFKKRQTSISIVGHHTLGTRMTFGKVAANSGPSVGTFGSKDEAIKALQAVLLKKQVANSDIGRYLNDFADESDLLEECLLRLSEQGLGEDGKILVATELFDWFVSVSMSGSVVDPRDQSYQNFVNAMLELLFCFSSSEDLHALSASPGETLSQSYGFLDNRQNIGGNTNEPAEMKRPVDHLVQSFRIWLLLSAHRFQQGKGLNETDSTEWLVVLFEAGLDPVFHREENTELVCALNELLCAIIVHQRHQLTDKTQWNTWMQSSVVSVVDGSRRFDSSNTEAKDGDENGYLAVPLVCSLLSPFSHEGECPTIVYAFKTALALHGAKQCLSSENWEEISESVMQEFPFLSSDTSENEFEQAQWEFFFKILCGFRALSLKRGKEIIDSDSGQCLAIIDCLEQALLSSMGMFAEGTFNSEGRMFRSKHEASRFELLMGAIGTSIEKIKPKLRSQGASQQMLSLAEQKVVFLKKFCTFVKESARVLSGQRGSVTVQKTMKSFLEQNRSMSDDADSEDEGK